MHGVKGEPSTHRGDVDFVFVASTSAGAARLIVPQLKFNYAGDVPVYSTSDSFEPDPSANADIDGMFFPDMPWMVSADPVTSQIRDTVRAAWPVEDGTPRSPLRVRLRRLSTRAGAAIQSPQPDQRDLGRDRQTEAG